jgi:two-component system cell cycle sensor histidine kinase/response regulator CckA
MFKNGLHARKILVAEASHPPVYAPLLRAEGYETELVSSGAEALRIIQEGRCHIAVLEEDLADQAALHILRATRGSKVPIIFCSQAYNANRAVQAMKEGAWHYLPRPFHKKDLLGAVAGALQSLHAVAPVPEALAERQRQAQKMELFGRLASGVIHDFNNLLTVILGYCDLINAGPGGSASREHVREIEQVVHNGAALTGQLLSFARNRPIEPRPLDLNFLILKMEAMLARLLGETIQIDLKLASGLGMIRADLNQLEQVILNLAVNARDAMPDGGRLTFETRNVAAVPSPGRADLTPLPVNQSVILSVTDTGCGMDEATQDRLFEPFFTTKAEGQGTGLGLTTVFRIVAAARGRIDVRSRLGAGTSFALTFPRLADPASPFTIVPEHEIACAPLKDR